jgi:hypothetical protein
MMRPGVHFDPVPFEDDPEHQFDEVTGQPLVPLWRRHFQRVVDHLDQHHERGKYATPDEEYVP